MTTGHRRQDLIWHMLFWLRGGLRVTLCLPFQATTALLELLKHLTPACRDALKALYPTLSIALLCQMCYTMHFKPQEIDIYLRNCTQQKNVPTPPLPFRCSSVLRSTPSSFQLRGLRPVRANLQRHKNAGEPWSPNCGSPPGVDIIQEQAALEATRLCQDNTLESGVRPRRRALTADPEPRKLLLCFVLWTE